MLYSKVYENSIILHIKIHQFSVLEFVLIYLGDGNLLVQNIL